AQRKLDWYKKIFSIKRTPANDAITFLAVANNIGPNDNPEARTVDQLSTTEKAVVGTVLSAALVSDAVGIYSLGKMLVRALASAAKNAWGRIATETAKDGCFAAGTLVDTVDGQRPIDEIREGDLILSMDEESGEIALHRVSSVSMHDAVTQYDVAVCDGFECDTLRTTANHPFWVEDKGWIRAEYLESGDRLVSGVGAQPEVSAVERTERRETVFNIEVEGLHTYFVGELRIWVHNKPMVNPRTPLPTLDRTGKAHGELPRVKDFGDYTADELRQFRGELQQSVQKRIETTSRLGRHKPHGERQAAEQTLIRQIDKYLEDL
ncbi:MAG: Hint domain-containing protein, partial [Pseudomonadota bacterium]